MGLVVADCGEPLIDLTGVQVAQILHGDPEVAAFVDRRNPLGAVGRIGRAIC